MIMISLDVNMKMEGFVPVKGVFLRLSRQAFAKMNESVHPKNG